MSLIKCLICGQEHVWMENQDLSWQGIRIVNNRVLCQCGATLGTLSTPSYPSFKGKSFAKRGDDESV